MTITVKLTVAGILFLLTVVTGVVLSHSGRPLSSLLINAHKLIALATVVFAVIAVLNLLKGVSPTIVMTVLMIAAGLSFIALFATGALLTLDKPAGPLVLPFHAVLPILAAAAAVLDIYLLLAKR